MESQKYSFLHLKIESNYYLEIIGSRKGLAPFVLDFSIQMGKNQILSDNINLNTPYVQASSFLILKNKLRGNLEVFKENLLIKGPNEKNFRFFLQWKPIDYLAHELLWSIDIEVEQDKKKENLVSIIGKIGQKKFKNIKKNITLLDKGNRELEILFKEIINLIKSKKTNFDDGIIKWLID